MTEHEYDDAGRMVRSVTRMAEPEWDDHYRDLAEGLAEHDRAVHTGGCGLHPSLAGLDMQLEQTTCEACATVAGYQRKLADADEEWRKTNKDAAPGARRPTDGIHVHLRALTPQEAAQKAHEAARKTGKTTATGRRRHG